MPKWAMRFRCLNGPCWYVACFGEFDCCQFQKIDHFFKAARFRYALRGGNHFSKIGAVGQAMPSAFCKTRALWKSD
jgi:hypothetical protein